MSHFYIDLAITRCADDRGRIAREILGEHVPLEAEVAVTPSPVPFAKRKDLEYRKIREGEHWGSKWDCGWFHLKGRIPKEWAGEYVVARIDLSGEILVLDAKGDAIMGMTNGSVFAPGYSKDLMHIAPECKGGENIELWCDATASALFGLERCLEPDWLENKADLHGRREASVTAIRLCKFDYDKWQLWIDLSVLEDLVKVLPDTTARRYQIMRCVDKALTVYNLKGAKAARAALKPAFDVASDPSAPDVTGVGHAHIDTAWLWPVSETIRKCARTFSSQISLIKKYPDYVFGASQAQLYAFTKEHYPKIYGKIKKAVAAGRWEVQGGMWVEADCNLISGESMIRQFVHGMNFFKDEFGVEVKNLWLPDVFGYSGNLPQILNGSGIGYFLTQKLSWNRYNKFPHNTFIWRGIDGSEVLAHFPPENTYNSGVMPGTLVRNEADNQERGLVNEALCLFGMGDGGGGPKEEHIERGLRLRDLNGLPRFKFGHAQPVLEKMAEYRDDLATWSGELYFETHRGTLTSQAYVKRWNRRAEEALRAAEMVCSCADLADYPLAAFDKMWKTVLLNQFHDIIPGSSIHKVYEETVPQLQCVVKQADELMQKAAQKLFKKNKDAITVFNPSTEDVDVVLPLPGGWRGAASEGGTAVSAQQEPDGIMARVSIPGQKFITLMKADGVVKGSTEELGTPPKAVLENDLVLYEFNSGMQLVRGFDKEAGVEFMSRKDSGNRLEIFVDYGRVGTDAWDVDEHYMRQLVGVAKVENVDRLDGTMRSGLAVDYTIGDGSIIRQKIWLGSGSKRLDFITEVDWKETHKLMRVAFPTSIKTDSASFEIQYGLVKRSTNDNTKWQYAQFECAAHRYTDLSDAAYGVALLNDSKYGHRVKGGSLEISLLRSPTDPDPIADKGEHLITYALLPHCGALAGSGVRAAAAELNQGVEVFDGFEAAGAAVPVAVAGNDGIDLAVLKKAEKGQCLVVRVVETRGLPSSGRLICADANAKIVPTDFIEWRDDDIALAKGKLNLKLKPFEIKTFKIQL